MIWIAGFLSLGYLVAAILNVIEMRKKWGLNK